jgi:hypothetical protein
MTAQLIQRRRSRGGQAMMELLVGIIALVVILVGIVQLGEGGFQQLNTIFAALRDASQNAISGQASGTPYMMIQDWADGRDQLAYTADDQAVYVASSSFYNLARNALSEPVDYPAYAPYQQFGQYNFASRLDPGAMTTSGWAIPGLSSRDLTTGGVYEHEQPDAQTPSVQFGDALQRLVYDSDKITVRSEVYLPPLSGSW